MGQLIEFATRHPLLISATVISMLALIAYEIRQRGQAGVSIGAQQAVGLINQGATVLDLRDAGKFAAGHMLDAVNVQPEELAGKPEARIRKKKPVLLVCDTGASSAKLVNKLRQAGFESTWSLEGGYATWLRENLPVVATRARS